MFQKILHFLSKNKNVSKDSSFSFQKKNVSKDSSFSFKKKKNVSKDSPFSFKKYYKSICKKKIAFLIIT